MWVMLGETSEEKITRWVHKIWIYEVGEDLRELRSIIGKWLYRIETRRNRIHERKYLLIITYRKVFPGFHWRQWDVCAHHNANILKNVCNQNRWRISIPRQTCALGNRTRTILPIKRCFGVPVIPDNRSRYTTSR